MGFVRLVGVWDFWRWDYCTESRVLGLFDVFLILILACVRVCVCRHTRAREWTYIVTYRDKHTDSDSQTDR